MADDILLESQHLPYVDSVLSALVVAPGQTVNATIQRNLTRNAATLLTAVLSYRLGQAGQVPERFGSGKTTYRWGAGTVNFRNFVGNKSEFWTNLYLDYADQLHNDFQTEPLVFVLASWKTNEETIHLWAIPEPVMYAALKRLPAGETPNKKSIRIKPETSRILGDPQAEDLSAYYRRIELTTAERSLLSDAYESDLIARKNKNAESDEDAREIDSLQESLAATRFWQSWAKRSIGEAAQPISGSSESENQRDELLRQACVVARELCPSLHWRVVMLAERLSATDFSVAILDDRMAVDPGSGFGIVLRALPDDPHGLQLSMELWAPPQMPVEATTGGSSGIRLSQGELGLLANSGLAVSESLLVDRVEGTQPGLLAHRNYEAADLINPNLQPTSVLETLLRFLKSWCEERYGELPSRPGFLDVLNVYRSEKTVFYSSVREVSLVVDSIDDAGTQIRQVDGNLSERITLSGYEQYVAALANQRPDVADAPVSSPLILACYLQGPDVGKSRTGSVVWIPDDSTAIDNLIELVDALRSPELYKPAVVAVVLEGIERAELLGNRIEFDWVAPRFIEFMRRLGREVTENQAAEGFARLAGDGFWLLAHRDPAVGVLGERLSSRVIRNRITHASLKEPYWHALGNRHQRRRVVDSMTRRWWPETQMQSTRQSLDGLDAATRRLASQVDTQGFVFEPWQIAAYITAIRTKPFVILAGVSGTGKSKLPALVAEATGAARPRRIAVRPDWTDSSEVMGYVDLQDRFRPGLVLQALRDAAQRPDQFHVCLVDEMNLARVEHYFAEFLSAVEDRRPAPGGGYESTAILTQSLTIDPDLWQTQQIPPNLAIVGTVNMDDSTHGFSRKVLDRAFTLELSDVDLSLHMTPSGGHKELPTVMPWPRHFWNCPAARVVDLTDDRTGLEQDKRLVIDTLSAINRSLVYSQLQVGYRTRDEVALFVINARDVKSSFVTRQGDAVDPLDLALLMKILPRVVGGSNSIRRTLLGLLGQAYQGTPMDGDDDPADILRAWEQDGRPSACAQARFPRTAARLCLMWERLNVEGYTSFWL